MNIYIIIILLFSVLTCILSVYILFNRKNRGAVSLSCLLISITIYSLGYAFELSCKTLEQIFFWLHIEYIGISLIPAFILVFALQFTGKNQLLTRRISYVLYSISLTSFIIQISNSNLNLFYKKLEVEHIGNLVLAMPEKGLWYWVHSGYIISAIFISFIIFLSSIGSSNNIYRRQLIIMLASSIIPFIVYLFYLTGMGPEGIDLTPFGLTIASILITIGLFQYKLFRFTPIALGSVFESMRDGVILIDINNNIVNYNPSAKKIIKNLSSASIGKDAIYELKNIKELIELLNDDKLNSVYFNNSYENKTYYYQADISQIKNKKNYKLGYLISIYDITAQKESELILINNEHKLSQLNDTKDKFFSIIAHDLRGPVGSLHSIIELLTDSNMSFSINEAQSILLLLKKNTKITYQLLENLLTWARSQREEIVFNPLKQNLCNIIQSNIDLYSSIAENKKITLKSELVSELYVFFDYDMIYTVIRNLINNAIKYTDANGSIIISAKETEKFIEVSVKDTGIGIDDSTIDKLFRIDIKVISKEALDGEKGSGLGLILCKEFIEKHGGKIWVKSELGKGSEFKFTLTRQEISMDTHA